MEPLHTTSIKRASNAFTLFEVLLVLTVLSVLLLTHSAIKPPQLSDRRFMEQMTSKLRVAQQHAIISGSNTTVLVTNQTVHITSEAPMPAVLRRPLELPQSLKMPEGVVVTFKGGQGSYANGRFQTVVIHGASRQYRIVFQMGSGRFYVSEQ